MAFAAETTERMQSLNSENLKQPILILAPMAGITDLAFRLICREMGADVVYSEMVSATGIYFSRHIPVTRNKSLQLAISHPAEQPLFIQLFGNQPDHFAFAAELIDKLPPVPATNGTAPIFDNLDDTLPAGLYRPAGIDINFGCPVKKVMKQQSGCSLMRTPQRAREIVLAVLKATSLPVSVKIRSGIEQHTALEFLKSIEDLDWKTVIVHGRTYSQGFSGPVDLELIKTIKQLYPDKSVIANGGIVSPETAQQVWQQTGADGLAIARGCLGNPWLFSQIKSYLTQGHYDEPSFEEIKKTALRQLGYIQQHLGQGSLVEMRKHFIWYLKGLPKAKEWKNEIMECHTVEEIQKVLS